jgi:uncharacterized membrane protein
MDSISIEPVFGWYAAVTLAGLLLASLWLTLTNTGLSMRGRLALTALRLMAAAVVFLGWLRPGLISKTEHESSGAVAVAMDTSQSMALPSKNSGENRWVAQQNIWNAIVAESKLKIGGMKVIPYFFDQTLKATASDDLPNLQRAFKENPNGRLTDLGKALSDLQKSQIDPPLRAVILISDGTQTSLPPEVEPTNIARQMAQLDQPLLLFGVGPRTSASQFRDIALEGVPEHFDSFDKNVLQVPVVVRATGVQGQTVDVKLSLRSTSKPEPWKEVGTKALQVTKPSQSFSERLQLIAPEPGEYVLEVAASAKKDFNEAVPGNNQVLAFVTIREGGSKILYLEGEPRYEQKYLKWSLNSSRDFVVHFEWLKEKNRSSWPMDLTKPPASVDFSKYDVIMLGDLDSTAIADSNLAGIRSRVENGAGLLLMGGYHSFEAGGYGRTKLAPAFPVELGNRTQPFGAPIDALLHSSKPSRIKLLADHPITALAPEPENTQLWRNLKPMQSINRFGRLNGRMTGVQVLASSEENEPILVTGEFGRGRVLAFAGDSTWQWWLDGEQEAHKLFWRQAILWLLKRDAISEGFGLKLDRRRLLLDESATLKLEWFGGSEQLAMPQKIKLELRQEGNWLRNLESTVVNESKRESIIKGLERPGVYDIALTATSETGKEYRSNIAFVVRDESRELSQPDADWTMLSNLASANATAGGHLPEDVSKALDWLRQRQDASKVTLLEKRRLGDAAWDAWLYLLIFTGLLSLEWALRKAWQLP